MQLCIPGGHCEPPSRGTWAKGYGLPAETGACSPTCAQGKKGEGPTDPTRVTGSSLPSWIPSLGLTAPLFYSTSPKSSHFLQLSMACLHSDLPSSPPILPTHLCLMGTDPALPRLPDGDSAWEGDTSHWQSQGLPSWTWCL